MSSQPHLQMINASQATHDEERKFHCFPQLPKELRLKIWRHTLQRRRMINIRLNNQRGQTATQAGENPASTSHGERYFTLVEGSQLLSKLLRVNKESREEVSMFYRVHLPCTLFRAEAWPRPRPRPTCHGTLPFNPEWDFLRISWEWQARDTLVDFLYHLKTVHDPRHIGLLNLAVDVNCLDANDLHALQSSDLDFEVRSAFVETLSRLREIWFVSTPRAGRRIVGILSGLGTSETTFNRSLPVMTKRPAFERLHRDPRPIDQDLKSLTGLAALPDVYQLWLQLLKKWCTYPPRIEYRFLLAFDPTIDGGQVSDRTSAKTWLQEEDDKWHGLGPDDGFLKDCKLKYPVGAEDEKYRNEDLEKAVRPAFGFWLFPAELGPMVDKGFLEDENSPKAFLNMTEHWPELALSSLP